jgi:hypothetical protein
METPEEVFNSLGLEGKVIRLAVLSTEQKKVRIDFTDGTHLELAHCPTWLRFSFFTTGETDEKSSD